MRPHNSGHWTIEGARTSQFEQHLRAVLDYPLGATAPTAPVVVMANVLGRGRRPRRCRSTSGCTTSSPGSRTSRCTSTARPAAGRKIGHVTVLGDDLDDGARAGRALAARWLCATAAWTDGWSP